MVAQWCRRCPSMGWNRVAWQAVYKLCSALGLHSSSGRLRCHPGARIRAPHAHRCSPLSNMYCVCTACGLRVVVGGCCCYFGARIDERARQDAAAHCSTSACIARSNLSQCEQRQMSALHGFRWSVVAPRWLRWLARALLRAGLLRPAEHELFASGGDRAIGIDVPPLYSQSLRSCTYPRRLGCAEWSSRARYSRFKARIKNVRNLQVQDCICNYCVYSLIKRCIFARSRTVPVVVLQ